VRLERLTGHASEVAATDVTAGQVAVARAKKDAVDIKPIASGRAELLQSIRKAGTAVVFTQVADKFATSHAERGLKTWRLGGAAPLASFEAKIGRAESLATMGDAVVQVARLDRRGVVMRWWPGTATAKSVTLPQSSVRSLTVSPDGEFVAESGDEATRIYRLESAPAESILRLSTVSEFSTTGKAWCLALTPQARYFAVGFWDGKVTVHRIHRRIHGDDEAQRDGAGTSTLVFERKLAHTPTHIALAADGAALAVFTQKDGLLVFDVATGERRQIWAPGAASVTCGTFSADGDHLVAGLSDGTARIWSVANGNPLVVVNTGHVPRDIAWLPKRRLLATASGDVKLWRCELQ
jgi:WD40 repeat protein